MNYWGILINDVCVFIIYVVRWRMLQLLAILIFPKYRWMWMITLKLFLDYHRLIEIWLLRVWVAHKASSDEASNSTCSSSWYLLFLVYIHIIDIVCNCSRKLLNLILQNNLRSLESREGSFTIRDMWLLVIILN